jgi:tRNA dimethylallyltransferase
MGPTASGKTDMALQLAEKFPMDLVSVDSALVYRGMDIGTAKPDAETLRRVPHRLIDIRNPEDSYSAGDFVRDARVEIDASLARGRIPLLVGGTMMYFRALIDGIAELPEADAEIRAAIDAEAEVSGWPEMHAKLAAVDAIAAARIKPNDSQRIQRALEVYRISGKPLSEWQAGGVPKERADRYLKMALLPMVEQGFVEEVRKLMARPGLTARHPSMRAVGYRQIWACLEGQGSLENARQKALAATRQLAKRQLTWLRSERGVIIADPLDSGALDTISTFVAEQLES